MRGGNDRKATQTKTEVRDYIQKTLRWYSESAYVIGECAFVQFMLDGAQCLAQIVVSVEDGFVSVSGGQHTSSTCTQCHSFDSTTLLVTMTLHSW